MNRLRASLLILLPAAAALAAAPLDLGKIAGQYQYRNVVGFNDQPKESLTDRLQIVRLSARQAYVAVHLNFFNGHECNFDKVMRVEGHDLVYKGPNGEGDPCEMRLHFADGKATFEDRGNQCRIDSCGSRGSYTGEAFSLPSRRSISAPI